MKDTPAEFQKKWQQHYMSMSLEERLEAMSQLYIAKREMVYEQVKRDFPNSTSKEISQEVFKRFYAKDLTPSHLQRALERIS